MSMGHASGSALGEHHAVMSVSYSAEDVALNVSAFKALANEPLLVVGKERVPKKVFRPGVYRNHRYLQMLELMKTQSLSTCPPQTDKQVLQSTNQ